MAVRQAAAKSTMATANAAHAAQVTPTAQAATAGAAPARAAAGGATRTATRRPQTGAPVAAPSAQEDARVLQLAARRGKAPTGEPAGTPAGAKTSDAGDWEEF
ncbi:chemotaxis protein [Pandoraea captiosa]|uniref:Chemotaxis protein n=1 Tax=Pandoraea captiosa TaxID=2508302 RepID=A0A5E5ABP2_9BURK|nr:hypothetical protein [Pandoraea captiosa]VVE70556.1 chemotaxis protein [Pandoraea captiosa]